jgi:hypothetical protein
MYPQSQHIIIASFPSINSGLLPGMSIFSLYYMPILAYLLTILTRLASEIGITSSWSVELVVDQLYFRLSVVMSTFYRRSS